MQPLDIDEMRETARTLVAEGFDEPSSIEDSLLLIFELEETLEHRAVARALLDRALADHAREQATWPAETDCDRLERVFANLEARGIVARQNFTCCNTCGVAEIASEIAEARAAGRKIRGYVFFHAQATEQAALGHELLLSYGPADTCEEEGPFVYIGRIVQAAFREECFEVRWSGSADEKIAVKLTWRRRRPERAWAAPS